MKMNRKVYREIAKKYGTSVREVKIEIQKALAEAYKNPTSAALNVPRKNAVPTIDEFIDYSIKEIEKDDEEIDE